METGLNKSRDISADDRQFIRDITEIVYTAKQRAYRAADIYQIVSNWLVGRRIVEQEQHGHERAEYGKHVIELASEALTAEFGKGYGHTQIKNFKRFYLQFRFFDIKESPCIESNVKSQTLSDQSKEKSHTVSDQSDNRIAPLFRDKQGFSQIFNSQRQQTNLRSQILYISSYERTTYRRNKAAKRNLCFTDR